MESEDTLLKVGRPVVIMSGLLAGHTGVITDYDHLLKVFLVNTTSFSQGGYQAHELKPLFTLDQVVEVKLEEQETGSDLADKVKPFGLSSQELADFTGEFIKECQGRIKGVGNQQYSEDGFQKFEAMELDDLLEYLEEEILDIPNYCAMLFIRVRRMRQALNEVYDLGQATEEEYEGGTITADDFKEEN